MRKGKAWLKEKIQTMIDEEYRCYDPLIQHGKHICRVIMDLIDQLDEPKTLSQEWVDENVVEGDFRGNQEFWYGRFIEEEKLKKLLVPKQEKPVIPQFVADWIERQKQPDWDYDKKEDALADSIHFTLYSLHTNYPETNPDVVLRKPINEWLNDDRKNYWKLIDGVRYGYEVEKEKRYYIINKENNATLMTFELSDVVGEEIIEFVDTYSENETVHFDSKEKAELIAHFVGDFVEVEEVKE